jgi:transcriptional regulator with XRE-family HTH domain
MSEKFDLDKQIGQKIKEARLEFGYSQTNLADVLGFESPTAVSLIESGNRSLKIRDLIILCQLFMKDYDYFISQPDKYRKIKI